MKGKGQITWSLNLDLYVQMFVIEHCWVMYLKSLVSKIYEKGSILVVSEESKQFITSARVVTGTRLGKTFAKEDRFLRSRECFT